MVQYDPKAMVGEIRKLYQRCQSRYPTIDVPFEEFLARIQQVVEGTGLPGIHCEDLFLAMACARGDRIAWEYFADDFAPAVHRFAVQACRELAAAEDLAQDLVRNLLEDRQKIGGYNGRGSLLAWLRVSVSRAAIDRFRRARKEKQVPLEEVANGTLSVSGLSGEAGQPGANLDAHWGSVFSKLLEEEIGELPAEDRLLLQLYYVEGITLKSIADHFRVHESTASRRLDGLRERLRRRVRKELQRRHGLRPGEIESLWEFAAEEGALRVEKALK